MSAIPFQIDDENGGYLLYQDGQYKIAVGGKMYDVTEHAATKLNDLYHIAIAENQLLWDVKVGNIAARDAPLDVTEQDIDDLKAEDYDDVDVQAMLATIHQEARQSIGKVVRCPGCACFTPAGTSCAVCNRRLG